MSAHGCEVILWGPRPTMTRLIIIKSWFQCNDFIYVNEIKRQICFRTNNTQLLIIEHFRLDFTTKPLWSSFSAEFCVESESLWVLI